MNSLPYYVQIFLKLAVLAVFQNFPYRFFFHPSESVRTMSDELSRIVAVLRHYDSVRIAQGVRDPYERVCLCVGPLVCFFLLAEQDVMKD